MYNKDVIHSFHSFIHSFIHFTRAIDMVMSQHAETLHVDSFHTMQAGFQKKFYGLRAP